MAYRSNFLLGTSRSLQITRHSQPDENSFYDAPGYVSDFNSSDLKQLWNDVIRKEYNILQNYHGRFFTLAYNDIPEGKNYNVVKWSADPAEPSFCFNESIAKNIADWKLKVGHPLHSGFSVKGRRETHNEYCEYKIIFQQDKVGNLRPKRVIFTTELREYWTMLAQFAPTQLLSACYECLGREPEWSELYGPGVTDPNTLSPETRLILFSIWVAGGAGKTELLNLGVPVHPIGTLNNEGALFMTHRINGLDDLLYIVLYGAHPYSKRVDGTWVFANKDEIFSTSHFGESSPPIQLACRHADPAAAVGAAKQAFDGRQIGFANPLGMYIQSFADRDFLIDGESIPADWIDFKRGHEDGLYQRLEFGPKDSDDIFLDQITVGDEEVPVTGGFQISKRIEVGPWLRIGRNTQVTEEEYSRFEVSSLSNPYNCSQATVCRNLSRVLDEYNQYKSEEI